jgi:hypothetical protein
MLCTCMKVVIQLINLMCMHRVQSIHLSITWARATRYMQQSHARAAWQRQFFLLHACILRPGVLCNVNGDIMMMMYMCMNFAATCTGNQFCGVVCHTRFLQATNRSWWLFSSCLAATCCETASPFCSCSFGWHGSL